MFNFSAALELLRDGLRVARSGWNGAGLWVVLQKGYPQGIPINAQTSRATGVPEGTVCAFRPYLMIRSADGAFVPWVPTQSDLLEADWYAVTDYDVAYSLTSTNKEN